MHPDSAIVDLLGGATEVARLCRIRPQAVSQWRRHGIPQARRDFLALLRPDVFGQAAQRQADTTAA